MSIAWVPNSFSRAPFNGERVRPDGHSVRMRQIFSSQYSTTAPVRVFQVGDTPTPPVPYHGGGIGSPAHPGRKASIGHPPGTGVNIDFYV